MCMYGDHINSKYFISFMDQCKSVSAQVRWKSMAGSLDGDMASWFMIHQFPNLPPKKGYNSMERWRLQSWRFVVVQQPTTHFPSVESGARSGFREWKTPQWPERALVWVYWGLLGHGSVWGTPWKPTNILNIPWKLMVGSWFISF